MKPDALVIEDDRGSRDALLAWLAKEGTGARGAETLAEARDALEESAPDLVLLDLELPDGSGLDVMDEIPAHADVVVISGNATVDRTVEAMRGGAVDILQKPVDLKRLRRILLHVRESRDLRDEIRTLRGTLKELGHFGPMVGTSPAMKELYALIEKVAPTEATVLISGETGTGKELVARSVHSFSRRQAGPFLPINCGAVAPNLIESELFGHEKGAFTGADKRHAGVFERAAGGTLFLDEITEMPPELQVKLLRVLESGEFRRIGGDANLRTDVRIVAATNRDPEGAVREGKLREDLLFRLKVFPLEVPPLRMRPGDAELLAVHFLQEFAAERDAVQRFTGRARAAVRNYEWPGNVRELRNAVERASIVADEKVRVEDLPEEITGGAGSARVSGAGSASAGAGGRGDSGGDRGGDGRSEALRAGMTIAETEKKLIHLTLAATDEKQEAARMLGISPKTLYNRLKKYEAEERARDADGDLDDPRPASS